MSHTIDASLEHALQEGEGGFSEGQADLSDPVGVPQQDGPSTSHLSEARRTDVPWQMGCFLRRCVTLVRGNLFGESLYQHTTATQARCAGGEGDRSLSATGSPAAEPWFL